MSITSPSSSTPGPVSSYTFQVAFHRTFRRGRPLRSDLSLAMLLLPDLQHGTIGAGVVPGPVDRSAVDRNAEGVVLVVRERRHAAAADRNLHHLAAGSVAGPVNVAGIERDAGGPGSGCKLDRSAPVQPKPHDLPTAVVPPVHRRRIDRDGRGIHLPAGEDEGGASNLR